MHGQIDNWQITLRSLQNVQIAKCTEHIYYTSSKPAGHCVALSKLSDGSLYPLSLQISVVFVALLKHVFPYIALGFLSVDSKVGAMLTTRKQW